MKNVEINILSGFLGSGKTTLLQKILEKEQRGRKKVAVVMNEIGQVSIDSDSVPKNTPLKELLNGCVCCTLSDQLEVQISELLNQYDLDAIYIETTGIAHPIEVLDSCLSPLLAEKVRIHSIITLLDAACWMERKELKIPLQKLIAEQVKHADMIVLNKIDCISRNSLKRIKEELLSMNPRGKIIPAEFASIDIGTIKNLQKKERVEHEKIHAVQHLHMKTYVHTFLHPISEKLFRDFLRTMPDTIYRIKGYIRFTGNPDTLLFQYAYGMPFHTKSGLKMNNTLVFIGDDLDHDNLQETLCNLEDRSVSTAH
ncbi:GTP-binding protein [Bacillus sonorensis]|uniref:Cobalamin synthesis protein/P47K family protein n=3 Tax=Bacillus sonorensis TaxID=119858 RepID=M5PCW5_9BACI|nr:MULTISPECIES: GTP-binding protein [Bacillus]TWK72073.1 putative metal chaperone YciC [Bacillus paralicheniformis]ASB89522.1 47 kDa protein [Bacillus sonorensis]EME74200.1 cobalamin synthesis protein/P47K family protein [Bacillus sonorensis L12]MBG9917202.1 cobalamin biosynthesis protein [Bacillus sonorensis]MCY7855144.1 GTP-binding protein [Bacillus sonorensis]